MSTTALGRRRAAAGDLTTAAVVVAVVTGAVHAALVPSHTSESVVLGAAFLVVAVLQVAWAAAAARGLEPGVALSGIALNLAVAAAWLVSRTVGLPVGDHPWVPEPAGVLDVLTTWDELLLVILLAAPTASGVGAVRRAALVVAALVTCVLVSGMGTH